MSQEAEKKAVLVCACSGICPSMSKINFWELAERVRIELGEQVEFIALHPRLCEPDGERFLANVLKQGIRYITPACLETKQRKLLKEGFDMAGIPMDSAHWIPVAMGMQTTESVFEKIKSALATATTPASMGTGGVA